MRRRSLSSPITAALVVWAVWHWFSSPPSPQFVSSCAPTAAWMCISQREGVVRVDGPLGPFPLGGINREAFSLLRRHYLRWCGGYVQISSLSLLHPHRIVALQWDSHATLHLPPTLTLTSEVVRAGKDSEGRLAVVTDDGRRWSFPRCTTPHPAAPHSPPCPLVRQCAVGGGRDVDVCIAVTTARGMERRRRAVRPALVASGMPFMFVVGRAGWADEDVAQDPFTMRADVDDAYAATVLKTAALLRCAAAAPCCTRIFKMDDDTFVNAAALRAVARGLMPHVPQIAGHVWEGSRPVRDVAHHSYVPSSLYSLDTFPRYPSGGAGWLATRSAVRELASCPIYLQMVREDVVDGVCAALAGVLITHSQLFGVSASCDDAMASSHVSGGDMAVACTLFGA